MWFNIKTIGGGSVRSISPYKRCDGFQYRTISVANNFCQRSNMAPRKRVSDVQQQGRPVAKSGKLAVAAPASFRKFFLLLTMHVCKRILLVDTHLRLAIYMIGVTVVSLVTDLLPFPKTQFATKTHLLNRFFVKIGWGWTCGLLIALIFLTSYTFCCGNKAMVRKHLARMGVASAWWYLCTTVFDYVEQATGFCTVDGFYTKKTCVRNNGGWLAFDISGHAFLLIHCLLTMSEEVKVINGWERIEEVIVTEENHPSERMTEQQLSQLRICFETLTPYIRGLIVVLTLFMILWEFMLLTTALYFHNMPQKVVASAFAATVWFISYHGLYKIEVDIVPVPVGKGVFKYMKD